MKTRRDEKTATSSCPVCGMSMAENSYCARDNAVASQGQTVHDENCDSDFKAGEYDESCNAFAFSENAQCDCGMEMRKGEYCGECSSYAGLSNLTYCENCDRPFDKREGCPSCGEADTSAGA